MNTSNEDAERVTIDIEMKLGARRVRLGLPVPAGATTPYAMLPLFRSLADTFVEIAVGDATAAGAEISCRKGCGACCRQLVPISALEARRLRDVVDAMPEDRRDEIFRRFAAARERLGGRGLLERLERIDESDGEERVAIGLEYFAAGIACPFLEEESCSIHPERPIACREYLVTSPAVNCATPTRETIECVDVTAKVSSAVMRIAGGTFVPLVLALEAAPASASAEPGRNGPDILRDLFEAL